MLLVEPELSTAEIYTLNSLIDCMFESKTETGNEKPSKEKIDQIYTDLDLLKKINKITDMEVDVPEENVENTKLSYGVWKIMPGRCIVY